MYDYAIRELMRRKERTLVNMAGYMAAVVFLSLLLTVLFHSEEASGAVLNTTGTHFIGFIPLCGAEGCAVKLIDEENEGFFAATSRTKLIENSLLEKIKMLDTIADAAPFLLFRLKSENPGSYISIGGLPPGDSLATANNSCSPVDIIEGRFFLPGNSFEVVAEASFAKSSFLELNGTIRLAGNTYRVVGIVDSGIRPAKADIYLPLEEARKVINRRVYVPLADVSSMFLLESKNSRVHSEAIGDVKSILGAGALVSSYKCYQPASKAMAINRESAGLITIVVYLGLLAFSLRSQFSAVLERKHEIGILTSIGWSRGSILLQLIYEALFQAFGGWLLGCLAALSGIVIMGSFNQNAGGLPLYPVVFWYSFLLVVSGGLIAGIVPGYSAANRNPAECLRRI